MPSSESWVPSALSGIGRESPVNDATKFSKKVFLAVAVTIAACAFSQNSSSPNVSIYAGKTKDVNKSTCG